MDKHWQRLRMEPGAFGKKEGTSGVAKGTIGKRKFETEARDSMDEPLLRRDAISASLRMHGHIRAFFDNHL